MVDSCRDLPPLPAPPRAVLREGRRLHLQRHRDGPEDADLRRLLEAGGLRPRPSSSGSPRRLDLAGAAPLLCAGITTWSPLRHWKAGQGHARRRGRPRRPRPHGGQAGRRARRRGHHALHLRGQGGRRPPPRAPTSSASPRRRPPSSGWPTTSISIIDTISAPHDYNAYLAMVRVDGTMVLLGVPPAADAGPRLRPHRRAQEPGRLAHRRHPGDAGDARLLRRARKSPPTSRSSRCRRSTSAYERMMKSDVRYRFVHRPRHALGARSPCAVRPWSSPRCSPRRSSRRSGWSAR